MNQTELIKAFIETNINDEYAGNAKIKGNQLIHFDTPILEKNGKEFIFNISNYSDITRFFQKKIKDALTGKKYVEVKGVTMNYEGSLKDFVKEVA